MHFLGVNFVYFDSKSRYSAFQLVFVLLQDFVVLRKRVVYLILLLQLVLDSLDYFILVLHPLLQREDFSVLLVVLSKINSHPELHHTVCSDQFPFRGRRGPFSLS